MSFNPLFANFNLCLQMCEKHYQKNKEDVDNKHALQAPPGFNNQLSDLTSLTVFFQATERSIFMKMMERGQVFVLLFHPLIKM